MVTFNPAAPVPAPSMSTLNSASSLTLVGLLANVVGVAAVTLVVSLASMDNLLAPNILVPPRLMSQVTAPELDAVLRLALGIVVMVIPLGARNLTLLVPVVNVVVSSLAATNITVDVGPCGP